MPTPPAGVTELEFPSGDMRLKAWLAGPAQMRERMPVVIFLHGGFSFAAEDFAVSMPYVDAGYVVVTPILRGEDGQAGVFTMFFDEVNDVLAIADHMRGQPYVDPTRIFLAGHSVGGTLAMLGGMASEEFRAVASFSGSPDQVRWLRVGGPWWRIAPFDRSDPDEFEIRSPLAYAGSLKSPTRLYYGSRERHFGANTQRMAEIARSRGLDVEAIEVPGDHFSAIPEEIALSIAFFGR